MPLLLTADPGLEDVVLAELADRGLAGEARPYGYAGLVRTEGDAAGLLDLRSVHHLIRERAHLTLPGRGLGDAVAALSRVAFPELAGGASFAVRVHRRGEHGFKSPDLERALGAVLVERYRAPVDLEAPDLPIRVDLFDRRALVGIQLTRAPLSRRYPKVYAPPAALKTTVAYGLLRLAGVGGRGRLLDPFTGSGTVAIEAAQAFPGVAVVALDIRPRAVAGAQANAAAAGVAGAVRFLRADARRLVGVLPPGFDWIVANPPFGRRLGRDLDLRALYARFLDQAALLLRPGGRLVFLAKRRGMAARLVAERPALRLRHRRVVELGGLYVGLFLVERRLSPA